ncbi:MAG: hypothetical protein ACMUHB_01065 [Thermoplasmatota archaeon]
MAGRQLPAVVTGPPVKWLKPSRRARSAGSDRSASIIRSSGFCRPMFSPRDFRAPSTSATASSGCSPVRKTDPSMFLDRRSMY